jgi:threonylcarbamoyladenosine tRNA methylthiotransferase MtaB
MSFKIFTLGCRANQYESAAYRCQLEFLGFVEADATTIPDICIINTCCVTKAADIASHQKIVSIINKYPVKTKIFVTGCFATKSKVNDTSMDSTSVDGTSVDGTSADATSENGRVVVVPNSEKEKLIEKIIEDKTKTTPKFSINKFHGHTRAFVKVQDGCNNFCSYCIIPYVRGRSRSRKVDDIIDEVISLAKEGYKEIVLTGIDIGDFKGQANDGTTKNLSFLLSLIIKIEGIERVRLSSIDPDDIDEEMIDIITSSDKMAKSMHIVLQSGSDYILKRMGRKYLQKDFLSVVNKLKSKNRDFTVTTDIIVGFPGETLQEFNETIKVVEEVGFIKVHMFPFSPREGTRAAKFEDRVTLEEVNVRKARLLSIAETVSMKIREEMVGTTVTVLLEQYDTSKKGMIAGYTDNFVRVVMPYNPLFKKNDMVDVKLTKNTPKGHVLGEIVV